MADTKDLYSDLLKVASSGDEKAAAKFLMDHLREFPEKLRDELAMLFFEDALRRRAEELGAANDFEKRATDLMQAYIDIEHEANVKEKRLDIMESA